MLARDYPEVVCGAAAAGSACVMYRLASVERQCARCHKQYAIGLNTAAACGYHHGVIISGSRDNGLRARWTCCGKWGPSRHSVTPPREQFCTFGRHLSGFSPLSTPEDVSAYAATPGVSAAHAQGLTGEGQPSGRLHSRAARTGERGGVAVQRTLVDDMLEARALAATQSVSWLGCGE